MAETEVTQKKPRTRGRLLVLATLVVLLLCCAPLGWQYYRVAAVQSAVVRNWEIMFDKEGRSDSMPKVLDDKLIEFLGNKENRWGEEIPYEVYRERVRALFRGRIEEILIYEHHGFRGDLGATLLHFPELKKLTVFENGELMPSEAELKLLCQRLRELPALEELELAGDQLSSGTLSPLAGHPKLRRLTSSAHGESHPPLGEGLLFPPEGIAYRGVCQSGVASQANTPIRSVPARGGFFCQVHPVSRFEGIASIGAKRPW
jgi:hypothetical protein